MARKEERRRFQITLFGRDRIKHVVVVEAVHMTVTHRGDLLLHDGLCSLTGGPIKTIAVYRVGSWERAEQV